MDAFTAHQSTPNAALDYYNHIDTFKNIFKSACYVAVTVISDAFIVSLKFSIFFRPLTCFGKLYRVFIVWGRSYLVITLPFLLFLADIGMSMNRIYVRTATKPLINIAIGGFWIYTLSLIHPGDDIWDDALAVRVKTFYSITLGLNFICTSKSPTCSFTRDLNPAFFSSSAYLVQDLENSKAGIILRHW